jgi:hypothetical protein
VGLIPDSDHTFQVTSGSGCYSESRAVKKDKLSVQNRAAARFLKLHWGDTYCGSVNIKTSSTIKVITTKITESDPER